MQLQEYLTAREELVASSVLVRTATVPAATSCDTNTPAPQGALAPTDAAAPTGDTPASAAPMDAAALLPATFPTTWQDVYSILQRVAAQLLPSAAHAGG